MNATDALPTAAALAVTLKALRGRVFLAPPVLTLSEWADRYRMLSQVSSAEPGRWRTDRAPYQRGIMDAISDPAVERVVFMKCAQVGATEILLNAVGYYAHQDPAPILAVQPTLDMARAWSVDRLKPMLRESPDLRGLVVESGRRGSEDTILHKSFPGGHLTVVGANSASGLASRPIRVVLPDEIDRYPASAGDEGDPVNLAVKRTSTFHNRKIVLASTPTLKGSSRIEAAFAESDQRYYHVLCPACDHSQKLEWKHLKFTDLAEPMYACVGCGELIPESDKPRMLAEGEWIPANPGHPVAGFHLNALYSPWAKWADLVQEWQEAQGKPERLQTFVNLVLGEVWEDRGGAFEAGSLASRCETYTAEVPDGVELLTAAVDVQGDRLELAVKGWGAGLESWLITYKRLDGDPGKPEVWHALDAELFREYAGISRTFKIARTGIDTGGLHTQMVYDYVRGRQGRGVFALKGSAQDGAPLVKGRPTIVKGKGVSLWFVGTNAAKDLVYARLRVTEDGPLKMHFPHTVGLPYFDGLTAERKTMREVAGRWVRRYVQPENRPNEPLDLEVYNLVALTLSREVRRLELMERARPVEDGIPAPPDPPSTTEIHMPVKPYRRPGRGFIGGWNK